MGSSQRGLYSVFHWRNVLYIMEVNKQRNGQFAMRFIYNEVYIYGGQQRNPFAMGNCILYIYGDKQTEKWAVHNEVYIQSSIGETFYI